MKMTIQNNKNKKFRSGLIALLVSLIAMVFFAGVASVTSLESRKLTGNLGPIETTDSTISYEVNGNVVIDGQGYTVTLIDSTQGGEKKGWYGNVHMNSGSVLTVKNVVIKTHGEIKSNGNLGAVFGYVAGSGKIIFENVIVDGAILSAKSCGNYVGGLVGHADSENILIECHNCIVQNSKISAGSYYVGGLIGFVNSECSMSSCDVCNCEIFAGSCSVGGLVGCVFSASSPLCSKSIEDCKVVDCYIHAGSSGVGGLVGFAYSAIYILDISSSEVENCVVAGMNYCGGVAGYMNQKLKSTICGCIVTNCVIKGSGTPSGGILGGKGTFAVTYDIMDCIVDSCTIVGSTNAAGICGQTNSMCDVNKCRVENACISAINTDVISIF